MQFLFRRAGIGAALVILAIVAACSKNEPPAPAPVSQNNSGATESGGYGAAEDKPKFDPIVTNGQFFEGWRKPNWALVITGEQHGYLEPCGCAGLDNQKGGLGRRFSFIKELEERGWPLVKVDVGGLIRRFGKQSELKFHKSVEAMNAMKYDAIGFGKEDLRLPGGELLLDVATLDESAPSPFVSANVGISEFGMPRPYAIAEAGGTKVGITAVLSESMQSGIDNPDVLFKPPVEAIEAILPELKEKSDLQILLSYGTLDESKTFAERFPDFDVIVSAGGADEPPHDFRKHENIKAPIIELGHKGMYAIVLGMYDNPTEGGMTYQRVALDSRFPDAPEIKAMRVAYQEDLKTLGWEGLELRPVEHPKGADADDPAGHFVGAAGCKDCHPTAHGIWEKSKHAHATETLLKLDPPRQYDPECISCHSTGWHPTEYYPYATGFDSMEATPHLASNSCENCHGPGAAHVAAENAKDRAERDVRRASMRLTRATAEDQVCKKCHDLDNSPEFNFDKYWPKVEHKGKK